MSASLQSYKQGTLLCTEVIYTSNNVQYVCQSAFCSPWWSSGTTNETTSWQPGILCGRSGHLDCINSSYFQESAQGISTLSHYA